MLSPEKCPYCFRNLGTWQKDPIFLPNGGPYLWTSDTEIIKEDRLDHRLYKGYYQICEPEVQEIQDFLKQTETDNLKEEDRTTFSPLTTSMKFQITGKHIKEMRDSVEKLLTYFGLTKTDYFNYDEEGNKITQPSGDKLDWADPITEAVDLKKFQVKYIHIEDLRHYISLFWLEPFDLTPKITYWEEKTSITLPGTIFLKANISGEPISFLGNKGSYDLEGQAYGFDPLGYADSLLVTSLAPGVSGIAQGDSKAYSLDDDSGESTKLGFIFNAEINHNVGSQIFGGIFYSVKLSRSVPVLDPINFKLTKDTYLSFNSLVNISITNNGYNSSAYIYFSVDVGNKRLSYVYDGIGNIPSSPFLLTKTEFETFNRNIYNDYITAGGIIIPDEDTMILTFEFGGYAGANSFNTYPHLIASGDFSIDNIKFYQKKI